MEADMNTQETPVLRFDIDTHHCQLTDAEIERLRTDLDTLERQVEHFPISDLHVLVEYNSRTTDYSVKTTLILPGARLVASDHDLVMHAAYERCIKVLTEQVVAYKERLGNLAERSKHEKGTHQDIEPGPDPDPQALDAAIAAGDYPAFRTALLGYEESLRKRVGRWIERYPDMDAQIGRRFEIADIVEEIFLAAFEEYNHRPPGLRLSEWLQTLIDPAIKILQKRGDEELENINMARSAVEAAQGPEAV